MHRHERLSFRSSLPTTFLHYYSRANPLGLTAWQLLICEKLKVTPEKILEWRADAGEWCTTTIPPALPAPPTPLPTQEVEKVSICLILLSGMRFMWTL